MLDSFYFIYFIFAKYLFTQKSYTRGEGEAERERERSSIHWFIPQMTQKPELHQSEARSFFQVFPCGCRGPRTWAISYHSPRP